MAVRVSAHKISDKGISILSYELKNKEMLLRYLTGNDYGIDLILELFDNEFPTGKIAYLQVKSTEHLKCNLQKKYITSPPISKSNLYYTIQKNIPFILLCVDTVKEKIFYMFLNDVISSEEIKNKFKTKTIRIPFSNELINNYDQFIKLINEYYK